MFDIRLVRSEPERVREAMARRRAKIDLDAVFEVDGRRRAAIFEMEQLRAAQNRASEEIAVKKRAKEDAAAAIEALRAVKTQIAELGEQVRVADEQLQEFLLTMPNCPDASVPDGADDSENRVERVWGEIPKFDFTPREHVELVEALGIVDFERAA
jgi:seryl-tRNA synthetase